jgi:hypothetical protein
MGLQQFEHRLERLVEGTFAKAFRGALQPVEIGRRLTREMDLRRTVGVRGIIAPNEFVVALSSEDAKRFAPFAEALAKELVAAAKEHARTEGYGFVGPVEVVLEEDRTLRPGVFVVAGEVREGPGGGPTGTLVLPDGSRVEVGDDPIVIGRLPGCDVVLDDPNVSRRHAEVRREDGAFLVADLGSTNGTRVNGALVRERRLADGDRITLGRTTLGFEVGT